MKIIKFTSLVISVLLVFISCQKQLDFETGGISVGSLQSSPTGDCSPVIVNGVFKVDSVLTNDNYVDVKVDVSLQGSFDIKSDTVNGYSFSKTGTVGAGMNTIRLYASGKPVAVGVNTFTISYGTTICSFSITVFNGTTGGAVFTLGGSPGNCSISSTNGVYQAGQAMTAANTVEMTVNVTSVGAYSVTGNPVNGVTFSASGVFINPGVQNIFLTATGTPATSGLFNFPVTNSSTSCNFPITFSASGPPAVYTLGGSPGNCTGVVLAGTYMVGTATGAANTATIDVNVTSIGSYSLSTTTLNGIKFSAAGNFAALGSQAVVLTANTATPTTAGPFDYPVTGGGSTCIFTVTYQPPPPPAAFTLSGAPGVCIPATVNGTYTAGTALTASNNVVVEVNVTTVGAYTISTNTVNGMQFIKSGVFSTTGLQNVTLLPTAGSNPVTAGTSTLTPQAGTSSCTFDITVAAPSDLRYSFNIGTTVYSGPCSAFLFSVGGAETMNIYDPGAGGIDMDLVDPVGAVTTGAYSGTSTSGRHVLFAYNTTQFASLPGSGLTNLSANITSINTTTRIVQGTFSGTVVNASLNVFTITNGTFKADF